MMTGVKQLFQNTRTRVLAIIGAIVLVVVVIYVGSKIFGGSTQGAAGVVSLGKVSSPQSSALPNAENLPHKYMETLLQSDQENAQQALKTGGSSVPMLIQTGKVSSNNGCGNCCQACLDCCKGGGQTSSSANVLNDMVKSGNLSPMVAAELSALQDKNVSVDDYAAKLNQLVAEGKLTPEQAQQLLAAYKAQKGVSTEGVSPSKAADQAVDELLASGQISPDVANQLKGLSGQNVPIGDYKAALDKLVREGKLTPEQAQQLLAAYQKQHAAIANNAGNTTAASDLTNQMLADGSISPDTAKALNDLTNQNLLPGEYAAQLDRLVKEGKLTPDQAKKLLAAYKAQYAALTQKPGTTTAANDLADQMLADGSITPTVANELKNLANQNFSPGGYAAQLDRMVKEVKLTPEQAKKLLAAYRLEHAALTGTAAASTAADDLADQLLANGSITPAVASQLKDLANQNLSPDDYAAKLNQLVKEGKITPDQAKELLAAYKTQHAALAESAGAATAADDLTNQMLSDGSITPAVVDALKALTASNVSSDDYAAKLNQLVKEGKITPDQAQKLLAAYRKQHAAVNAVGSVSSADDLTKQMLSGGSISKETANQLQTLSQKNASPSEYAEHLNRLVREGKLTPEQAKKLLAAYRKQYARAQTAIITSAQPQTTEAALQQMLNDGSISPAVADQLRQLQKQGLSAAEYAAQLNQLVAEGKLTPDQAMKLLDAYRAENGDTKITTDNPELAKAQAAQQAADLQDQINVLSDAQQEHAQQQQQIQVTETQSKLQAIQGAMSAQAQALFSSWDATPQTYQLVTPPQNEKAEGSGVSGAAGENGDKAAIQAAMIKAGAILFAVLDTGINSDRPGPVLATIVSGKFKGAKLIGGITQTPDGERVILQFTQMSMDEWPDVISINAVAINPDTAHTAIASSVDHHYLMRYGSVFASSFLMGYSQALQQSGSTVVNNAGTTSQTSPNISPSGRIMIGLGEVANQLSTPIKNNLNKLPTVKVDSGVGIGILFTQSVKKPQFIQQNQAEGSE